MDIRPCASGFAYAALDPAFGLAMPGGSVDVLHGPRTIDMQNKIGKGLEVSGDGAIVRFGLDSGDDKPVSFNVAAALLAELAAPVQPGMTPARIDGLLVTDWKYSDAPKFKGVRIPLDNYEKTQSLAVGPTAPASLWGRSGMFALSTRGQVDLETGRSERSRWRGLQRGRASPRCRMSRWHDPMAAGVGRRGVARAVRRGSHPPVDRLDADRILHGLAGRRGSDRLAHQSRLDAAGRLLPRPRFFVALQPAGYRATRVEDAG